MFLINSCSQLVSSTDFSSIRKGLHLHISVPSPEVTAPFCLVPSPEFSQAPWYSLPDHLCRFAVRAPSVSLAAFLGSRESGTSLLVFTRIRISGSRCVDLPAHHPTYLNASPTGRSPYPSASLLHSIDLRWYWNIYQFPIDYAFRPRLRSRLTLGGRAFPRNP